VAWATWRWALGGAPTPSRISRPPRILRRPILRNLLLGHGLGVLCDRQIAARRGPGTDCAEGIQQHGCRAARQAGIGAERLIFARRLPHERHLARLALADPALDTIFHAGGVTTIDALWAGVPVVTWAGVTHPARTGASILHDAGLPELVAPTLDRYRDIALQLARDPAALQGLRQRLARHKDKAPLFKPESLARHLERTFRLMVEQARSEEAPRAIVVPPLP